MHWVVVEDQAVVAVVELGYRVLNAVRYELNAIAVPLKHSMPKIRTNVSLRNCQGPLVRRLLSVARSIPFIFFSPVFSLNIFIFRFFLAFCSL